MEYHFLGDSELVTAFRFIGVEGTAVADAGDAAAAFRRITEGWDETAGMALPRDNGGLCRVLIMTEEVADWLGDLLISWQLSDCYPLVVEIPGTLGRLPGRKTLVDSIREAVGVHV
ncbi:MAG: ATPase V [Treponema sp.]|jgi:V/A-type H+-transporting ATPase subunit F|nr:ATPase V [Treponema sp.]